MRAYTASALAKALGLTTKEVESLRKAGVLSYGKGKTFYLEESAAAVIAHYKENTGEIDVVDYSRERALLMRAKRQDQEYDTRIKEGTLHEARDVEMAISTMLLNFRSRIMSIPSTLAPRIARENDTTAVFNMLKEATDDALNELSDYDKVFGNA